MWSGPGPDPGGSTGTGPPNTQELNDLKDQFEQQQLLIAQLKEMLRKSEQTTVTQEKVEEYANTLTKMKARAKRSARKEGSKESTEKRLETPASEKISLLRQQLEENRAKLAERGKSQRGIEEMVTQLKAQLDDSQILMNQTPLNLSLIETKQETYSANSSSHELYNILLNKERRISEMTLKIQKLEANVLDLQENLKEKDSVIDARTKAITLMSENLSKKGKSTLDALDDTKLQMRKMQENFVELEMQMKEENHRLSNEVQQKEIEITNMKQRNTYLEQIQQELTVKVNKLEEMLGNKNEDIDGQFSELTSDTEKFNTRMMELESLNEKLQSSIDLLENQNKSNIQEMEKLKEELETSNGKLIVLEKLLEEKQTKINEYITTVNNLESTVKEFTETKRSESSEAKLVNLEIKHENEEITKLKKQLDESNKNMIKVKAQHKSKIKELNKKIDSFKKMNDSSAEIVKLHDENCKLNQIIAELEEEKGALQLKIMEADSTKDSTGVEVINELERKLSDQAILLTEKDNHIDILSKRLEDSSTQIEELNKKLLKLSDLQNVQVKSEITSIQLEEQMDRLELEKQELVREKESILYENTSLIEKLEVLKKEKQEILIKLESYMQENIDLVDKLEKLSAEKVSSAESIEIVEGLTQQEKLEALELEAYQKNTNMASDIKTSTEHLEENPELNESVNQLTEETSELLQKIELFTIERREVMEKMEHLTYENNQLNLKIKEIENNRDVLAETYEQLQNEKEELDTNLETLKVENGTLEAKIKDLETENEELKKFADKNSSTVSDSNTDQQSIQTLQKDIEEYQNLIEIQRQEIKELKVHLMGQDFIKTDKLELEAKITSLQLQYQNILAENESLVSKLREQSEHVCQREDIEEELTLARKRISEFEEKIVENLQEIENYKSILEENKNELITSANLISELQDNISALKNEISHYDNEITHLNSVITDLNAAVAHLEKENKENSTNVDNVNMMRCQLDELKQALSQNIEQINDYQRELENNSVTIIQLQKEIKALNLKILETEHLLESKNDELKTMQKEREEKDNIIQHLTNELKAKDENFHQTINNFKEKYLNLQQQLEANTGSMDSMRQPLENKIQELEHKNREQLEKMKIIAANLKKKTQALQNLEQKYTEVNEKWEIEQKEKETLKEIAQKNLALEGELQMLNEKLNLTLSDAANQSAECQKLKEELCDYKQRSISLENMNTKLSEEISTYIAKFEDSQNTIKEYENRISDLIAENEVIKSEKRNNFDVEINEKEAAIKELTEELENSRYTSETNSNALQMKIQELEMFIETQDADLTKYKERVNKLEEGLSFMEERRMSLERTAQELGAQLREKTNECEEVSQTEDILEKRLSALMSHDEIIEKKLQVMTDENEELAKQIKAITAENDDLNDKIKQMRDIMNTAQVEKEMLPMLENEIIALRKSVNQLENDKRTLKQEYEQKLLASKVDTEKMEIELQNQLELFDKDRRNFAEQNEIMSDKIQEYLNQQEILTMELADHKQKLEEQNKLLLAGSEAYNKIQEEYQQVLIAVNELKDVNKIHEDTILKLNEQILSSSMEIEKLEQLKVDLQQKSLQLENVQKENPQNQVQSIDTHSKQFDIASSFFVDNDLQNLKQVNEDLHAQIAALQKEKESIVDTLAQTQRHLEEIKTQTNALKEEPLKSEELKSLKAQYNTLEMNYGKLVEENMLLQNQIVDLTGHLQKSSLSQIENDSLGTTILTWPNEEIPKKKIVSLEVTSDKKIDNTKEELQNKIRSLEFMLHDTEKQRNDALLQCTTLSEELTKLLYLQKNREQPSNEKNLNVDHKLPHFEHVSLDFESQIVSPDDAESKLSNLAQLHQYEYSPSQDMIDYQGPSAKPVVEVTIKPKSTYLCYNPDDIDSTKTADTFGENDDGWGWGPEEAKLEQEHFERASLSPQSEQFKSQINSLEEKIRVLEQARERHLEEIKQSQLKSGKLIKKLKEFKTKNEELSTQLNRKSDGFDDLNDAIQEELKSQIKSLEKKIKDINIDLDKERQEKNNLLKRVDTLTATHERMVENKEKQDVEIMSWQQRYREISAKLEQFEWGNSPHESPKHVQKNEISEIKDVDSQRVQELMDTIKDLTLDNEELQALLEEQRNIRIAAEKAKSIEPIAENMKTEEEYLSILSERDSLQNNLKLANDELLKLKESLSNQLRNNDEIRQKINALILENEQLREEINNSKSQFIEDTMQQVNQLNVEKQQLIDDLTKSKTTIEELSIKLDNLQSQSDTMVSDERRKHEENAAELSNALSLLNSQISSLSFENDALRTKINDFQNDKENILAEVQRKDSEKNELNNVITDLKTKMNNMEQQLSNIQNLNSEIVELRESVQKKEDELSGLREKLLQQETEYEYKLSETIKQLNEEWAEKVDQRGYDIAESWKLHLDARENEFLQVEQVLKKEINDLEEKYTTLVNENNELRKNVDTEIRNEVDRVSALQQQINERQQCINDLTNMLQDRQAEIERQKTEIDNLNLSIVELNQQIHAKSGEIENFKILITNKDDLLKDFTEKDIAYKAKIEEISLIEVEVENLKQALSVKDTEMRDRDTKIVEISQKLEEAEIEHESLRTEMIEKVNAIDDLSRKLQDSQSQQQISNDNVHVLSQQINEYQEQISNCHIQIQQQYLQIETLNQELMKYSLTNEELLQKETEINRLAILLQEKEREHSITLDAKVQENMVTIKEQASEIESLKRRLTEYENQYEEILLTKDVDMQNLRIQLEEQTKKNDVYMAEKEEFLQVQTELAIKTAECEEMKNKLEEQNLLLNEESKQLSELREIIQDQVLKIDDLQKELYEKSRHYDALIAEVDLTHKSEKVEKPEKHVKFSDEVDSRNTLTASNEDDLSEPVSRAELDLALYMLHQRDVRCEELTVELMQLLEERDTLQLKLSNSLREMELLKSKYDISLMDSSGKSHSSIESTPGTPTSDGSSRLPTTPESVKVQNTDPLVSKLSELKMVGYHKDKTIVDEQELRRLQQLSIMQQHRDEAARLPPEAAARLVGASYTLSRDVQSPSKVLLNWLWGRSTPRVNDV